jgi:hypothetical protein
LSLRCAIVARRCSHSIKLSIAFFAFASASSLIYSRVFSPMLMPRAITHQRPGGRIAFGVGLPDLDQRVLEHRAVAVAHAAFDADAFALGLGVDQQLPKLPEGGQVEGGRNAIY